MGPRTQPRPRATGSGCSRSTAERVWHPYGALPSALASLPVVSAEGVRLRLADGRELVDGMASWWCAIHGYRHPALDAAVIEQLGSMAHVMFGGLTHEPAVRLVERLTELAPPGLERVFLADSGSVSVEVAIKLSVQYQRALGHAGRTRLLTVRGGYHGDTTGAMAVCDPLGGMHSLFSGVLPEHLFAERPPDGFDAGLDPRWADRGARAGERERERARGGDRRARRAGRRRHALSLARVRGAAAARVRRAWAAACARRDRDRLRAHGRDVRVRARRCDTGCDVRRQGAHRRLHDARGHAVHRGGRRDRVLRRGRWADARPHVHGQPARVRGRARVAEAARRGRLEHARAWRSKRDCARGSSPRASWQGSATCACSVRSASYSSTTTSTSSPPAPSPSSGACGCGRSAI